MKWYKNVGNSDKFGLANPRKGGRCFLEIQEIPLVEEFEGI